jgi:dsDNA-binding SOS-regulon protein
MAYYAYTNIKNGDETIAFGEKVDQGMIDASDEEWQDLIATNAVGEEPVPEDLGDQESLSQYHIRKAQENMAAVQAGELPSPAANKKADESASSKS